MSNTTASELLPLVDGDILVYRLGFAAQQDEPLENVLHTVKVVIAGITDRFDAKRTEIFLTGKENFRDKIATLKPYKGNRLDKPKPQYYSEIRDYLIRVHGATVVNFQEADDAIGIRQMEERGKSVIVSIDKDLDMIPGWHYKFTNGDLYYVDKLTAARHFFKQVLTGDVTDNIPGIKGMGPRTAEKLLANKQDPEGWFDVVVTEYKKAYKDQWQSALDEMMQLLWIRRKHNEVCPWVSAHRRGTHGSTPKESESTTSPESDGESPTKNSEDTSTQ